MQWREKVEKDQRTAFSPRKLERKGLATAQAEHIMPWHINNHKTVTVQCHVMMLEDVLLKNAGQSSLNIIPEFVIEANSFNCMILESENYEVTLQYPC